MVIPSHSQIMSGLEGPKRKKKLIPSHEDIMSGKKGKIIDDRVSIEETKKKPGLLKKTAIGTTKLVARTGIAAANLISSTIDFAGDFLSTQIEKTMSRPIGPINPLIGVSVGEESDVGKKTAERWKNFYEKTAGTKTEEFKKFTENLNKLDFIQPSDEWQKASTKEKMTTMLPETIFNIGPGVVASLGAFAINPALGFTLSSGSVADEVTGYARESGLDDEKSQFIGLGTGVLVGWIDKLVPDELFSPAQKKEFMSAIAKRIVKTSLKELSTEVVQEDIQLIVESALRENLTMDEIIERNLMAGLGGLLGGAGSQTIVSFINNIRSGDIGGITEEDIETINIQEKKQEKEAQKIESLGEIKEEITIDTSTYEGIKNATAIVENNDTAIIRITSDEAPDLRVVAELEKKISEKGITTAKVLADDDTVGLYAQLGYKNMGKTTNGIVPMVKELTVEPTTKSVITEELGKLPKEGSPTEIAPELNTLLEMARKAEDSSEFVSSAIFNYSIPGTAQVQLEKYSGDTTAAKLESFYREVVTQPLLDFYNQASKGVTKAAESMPEAAQGGLYDTSKYKNADEFIKSQNFDNKPFDVKDDFMVGKSVTYEKLPEGYKIRQSHIDSISGEQIMAIKVSDKNGEVIGKIDYGLYHGEPNIKMIEVNPAHRRKGIATAMLDKMQEMYPDKKIDIGMSTEDGSALLKNYDFNKERTRLTDIYNKNVAQQTAGDLPTQASKGVGGINPKLKGKSIKQGEQLTGGGYLTPEGNIIKTGVDSEHEIEAANLLGRDPSVILPGKWNKDTGFYEMVPTQKTAATQDIADRGFIRVRGMTPRMYEDVSGDLVSRELNVDLSKVNNKMTDAQLESIRKLTAVDDARIVVGYVDEAGKQADKVFLGKGAFDNFKSFYKTITPTQASKGVGRLYDVKEKKTKPVSRKEIKIQESKPVKKQVFKKADKEKLQSQIREMIRNSETQDQAVKKINTITKEAINNAEDPLYIQKLKATRAEFRRCMFDEVGGNTGNWKKDYAIFQRYRDNPDISNMVDALEDGIFQIDDVVNPNAPTASLGYATMGSVPIGKFEQRSRPKTGTNEFKLYHKVQGLISKYAQSVGEGYTPRKALGVYYRKTKNIRVNAINDLSTASHEITHFLDHAYNISDKLLAVKGYAVNGNPIYDPTTRKYRKEITDLYTKYYPGGKKTHSLRKRSLEGFATLLQKYIEIPSIISSEYPLLVKDFLTKGGRYYKPVMGEIITDLNKIVEGYQGLNALDKIGSRVTSDKINSDKPSFLKLGDKIRTFLADEIYPIEVLATRAGKQMTEEDPSLWLRAYRSINGVIANNISTNRGYWTVTSKGVKKVFDFNWKTLVDELNTKRIVDDFGYYLVARREYFAYQELDVLKKEMDLALEMLKNTPKDQWETTFGGSDKSILEEAKEAKTNHDELKAVLDKDGLDRQEVEMAYEQNQDRFKKEEKVYDQLVMADLDFMASPTVQLITPTQREKLATKQGYASFKRMFYDEIVGENNDITGVAKVGKTRVSSLISRKGSQRTIINPLYNGITNHSEIMRKGTKQIVYNKIADIGVSAMFPDMFQELDLKVAIDSKTGIVTYPQEKDKNIIMGRINYKRKPVLIDSEVKGIIDNILTYQNVDVFIQLYTGLSRLFTAGTTGFYPQFAATNFLRDQITAQANTTNKYKALASPLDTFGKLVMKNPNYAEYYQEYLIMGGERQTFTGWQKLPPRHLFKRISQEKSALQKAIAMGEKGVDILSIPSKYSELITRASEYIKSRQTGNPPIVALEEAGRLTAPFHHMGTWGGKYGQTFIRGLPFFNAGLQVLDQHIRVAGTKDGRRRMALVIMAITASYLASMMALLKASDEQKEQYKDLEAEELAGYLFIPNPSGKSLIRVPTSEVFSSLGVIINMIIADNVFGTKYTSREYLEASTAIIPDQFDITEPVKAFFSWIPQVFQAGTETLMGVKTWPRVTPLESQSLKNLPPSLRTNENTSIFAKWLGKKLNMSPIKIDYLITGYFGRAMGFVTGKPSVWKWDSSIIRDYWFSGGRRTNAAYDLKEKNEQKYNAYQRGDIELDEKEWREVYRLYVLGNKFAEIMREYRKVDIEKEQEKAADIRNQALQLINMIENGDEPTKSELPKTYRSFEEWIKKAQKRRDEKIEDISNNGKETSAITLYENIAGIINKLDIIPEVSASDGEKAITSMIVENNTVTYYYEDKTFKISTINEQQTKPVAFLGEVLYKLGNALNLEVDNLSKSLGYKSKKQVRAELIEFAKQINSEVDNVIKETQKENNASLLEENEEEETSMDIARVPDVDKVAKKQTKSVSAIEKAAKEYDVPYGLLLDIAYSESNLDSENTAKRGGYESSAGGLFMFTDATWKETMKVLGLPENTSKFDPEVNAKAAAYLIFTGQLSRWDASKYDGHAWGQYYTDEELKPYDNRIE